jgi:exonuclease III
MITTLLELKEFEDKCVGLTLPISFYDQDERIQITIKELDIPNNKIKFDRIYGLIGYDKDLNQEATLTIESDEYKFRFERPVVNWVDDFKFNKNFSEGNMSVSKQGTPYDEDKLKPGPLAGPTAGPPAAPPSVQPPGPQQSNQVWCYDFDGVVHTKMAIGESMTTQHRNPDHKWLSDNFTVSNFTSLIPYLFSNTINHMKYGQSIGAKIVIVSANSCKYKKPICKILNYVGVKIKESYIHMNVYPKDIKLQQLKCTLFMDDSCANITKIYNAFKKNIIPTLEKLVFVVPEKEKEYNSPTHYEIDLGKDLNICNKPGWHIDLSKVKDIKLLDYPKHTFKLTSWNVYFKLMNPSFPTRLDNIKSYLGEPYRKPDILFTQESSFDLPFTNYTHIFFSSPGKSSLSTQFNNNIFTLNSNIIKIGLSDNIDGKIKELDYKIDKNIEDNTGKSSRPILAVKLTHLPSGKDIIFVNLWAPHNINKKRTGNMKIFFDALNKVINHLYTGSERIIMAGDFNEFYEQSHKGYKVDTIGLDKGVILYLKQRHNTCCGSNSVKQPGGLFHGKVATKPFDLYYDSDATGSDVRVGTNRMSDHLPISAIVTI